MLKRCFDFVLAILLSILLLPLILLIAIIVFASLGRPVMFTQVRPGLYGRPFRILKFRTMKNLFDKSGALLPDDQRLTPVGVFIRKFSLDELPQLFNVVKGDLSFVGPRPLLMEYLPLYNEEQMRRHNAKPGITGWTQVNGRNTLGWEEKFRLDLWYVENQNFFLDIKILWLTLRKATKREGINAEGFATMPKFTGSQKCGE